MAGVHNSADCQLGKCRSLQHADYIISCMTREDLAALKTVFRRKCGNAIKITDRFGRSALHIAVSCGRYDIAEWLVKECGADVNAKDTESGWNALHRSLYYGNIHCAVLMLQNGLDLTVQDRDAANPLKLVLLDSQRAKCLKNEKIKLGRVILPYHASEPGELSLEINELVDIIKEYKTTGWGFGRISGKKEKGKFPLNFIAILGDKTSEFSDEDFTKEGKQSDVYMWGNNSNLTLGQADAKSREYPDLVENLSCQKYSIKQVAVSKYHTVYLAEDGSVFTCGQGRGGRLGHGNEQTALLPQKVVSLNGVFCTDISTANDHTLVLDQMGQVHSFGLNTYHQLGHYPVMSQCLSPKIIINKTLKGKIFVGVAAARFHSAIYTKDELFSFGLNAGQLGHLKGDDFQSTPRLVSSLCKKDCKIEAVAISDGATCCLLDNGDIYILQDYEYRRIATKMTNIKRLVMTGGELKSKVLAELQHTDPDNLCIAVLKGNGIVQCWKQGYANFKECFWAGKKKDFWQVVDISLGKHLIIATDEGVVFYGHFRKGPRRTQVTSKAPSDGKGSANKNFVKSTLRLEDLVEKAKRRKEEEEEVMIEKVPLLYRAYRVFCDVKCRTFAVIQNDPRIGTRFVVNVVRGKMEDDLKMLLDEADLTDNIHDVEVEAKDGAVPAHRFILLSRLKGSDTDSRLVFDEYKGKYVLDLKKREVETVKTWMSDVYTGRSHYFLEEISLIKTATQSSKIVGAVASDNIVDGVIDDDALLQTMQRFSSLDLQVPDSEHSYVVCNENGDLLENLSASRKRKQKKNKEAKKTVNVTQQQQPGVAQNNSNFNGKLKPGFVNWQQMDDLSDIKIEAEDGILFGCHKCILVARLEYFRGMLGNPWMESSWTDRTIKMPMPGKILKIILDFVYLDESNNLKDCANIDMLCQIIVYADQLLIARLKEICESALVNQISLKNSLELLEFSCTYNSEQLKKICCEFICNNLTYFLEMRALETLPADVLAELSVVYKALIPNMAYRRITPSTFHLEQDAKETVVEQKPNENEADLVYEEVTKTKCSPRERLDSTGRKKRRRRRSSSMKEDSFSEETAPNTLSKDLSNPSFSSSINGHLVAKLTVNGNESLGDHVGHELHEELLPKSPPLSPPTPMILSNGVKSLKEIMEEEEKGFGIEHKKNDPAGRQKARMEPSNDAANPNVTVKWEATKKKSQKQRKEEMKSNLNLSPRFNEPSVIDRGKVAESKESFCPWAKSGSTPVKSFKDLMTEESQGTSHPKEIRTTPEKKIVKDARRKLSWKENKEERSDSTNRHSGESAWSNFSMAASPPSSAMSLSAIIKSQLDEKEASNKILKKPLQLIQIEEKAMEELLEHYNARDNPAEYITVRRIKDAVTSPVWNIAERK